VALPHLVLPRKVIFRSVLHPSFALIWLTPNELHQHQPYLLRCHSTTPITLTPNESLTKHIAEQNAKLHRLETDGEGSSTEANEIRYDIRATDLDRKCLIWAHQLILEALDSSLEASTTFTGRQSGHHTDNDKPGKEESAISSQGEHGKSK
jgi:hypothetical protein